MGRRVLTDLEDPVHVSAQRHLLVQLRRLRETRLTSEIVQREDSRAALAGTTKQLGGVNLNEILTKKQSFIPDLVLICFVPYE